MRTQPIQKTKTDRREEEKPSFCVCVISLEKPEEKQNRESEKPKFREILLTGGHLDMTSSPPLLLLLLLLLHFEHGVATTLVQDRQMRESAASLSVGATYLCPSQCHCEEDGIYLMVDCSELGLSSVPSNLNPLTTYL